MEFEKPDSEPTNLFTAVSSRLGKVSKLVVHVSIFIFFLTFKIGKERLSKNEQKAHKRTPEGKRLFFITCKANIV